MLIALIILNISMFVFIFLSEFVCSHKGELYTLDSFSIYKERLISNKNIILKFFKNNEMLPKFRVKMIFISIVIILDVISYILLVFFHRNKIYAYAVICYNISKFLIYFTITYTLHFIDCVYFKRERKMSPEEIFEIIYSVERDHPNFYTGLSEKTREIINERRLREQKESKKKP